jgi:hypothetical protein
MRAAVLLIALALVVPGVCSARHRPSHARSASHSRTASHAHSSIHPHSARRSGPSTPTPERYQEIQQALAARGYYSGTANGTWGADSVEALKRFQGDQNLTTDGKLTSLSLIAMGLGPKRAAAMAPVNSSSTPPATSDAPVTVQSNTTPAPQAPAEAH